MFVFFFPRLKIVFEYYLWSSLRSLLAWPGARNLSTYSHVNYAKLWRIYATLVRIVLHLFFSHSPSLYFLSVHSFGFFTLSLCRGQHGLHGEQLFEFKQRRQRQLTGLAVAGENVRCGCGKSANSRPGATQSVCGATTHLWLRSTHAWRLWCGG